MPSPSNASPDQTATASPAPTAAHRRVMFWVALLYFSEGLPLGLFYDLFPVHMRQAGVGPAEIGLLSLLGLAWTVKFLWAPLVDTRRGHRWWIAGANWGMALVLFTFALNPQAIGPGASWPWALLAAFTVLSATNDIATDGYTIELLAKGQYGVANGLRIGFYRVGMLTAGALLMVAGAFGSDGQANWAAAYGVGGVVMLLNGMGLLMAPAQPARVAPTRTAPSGEWAIVRQQPIWILALGLVMVGLLWPVLGPLGKVAGWDAIKAISGTWWFKGAIPVGLMFVGASLVVVAARDPKAQALADGPVFGAWVGMLSRPGMLGVLGFILLYKLGDTAIGFMIKPFWVDAGFTPAQIGMVSVNVGLGLSILGGLAGGWYVDRAGIFKGLWVFGLAQASSNLAYAIAAWYVPQGAGASPVAWQYQMTVYMASGLESITQGLGTGAFMAFLMSITNKERATTEYAILSSIFAFSRSVAGWAGGLGVEHLGYPAFFFMTVVLCFPAYLLLPAVRRMLDKAEAR